MSEAAKIEPEKVHQVAEFKYSGPLLTCRFDPAGQFVFASAEDFSIQRWNIAGGDPTAMKAHQSWVWMLAFHPTGTTMYSAGYDGRVIFWNAASETPEPQRTLEAHNGWVRAVAVSPDGKLLATCGNDHLVKLWNTADGGLVDTLAGHGHHVYNVAFDPVRPVLVSGDLKGVVCEWDLATGEELRTYDALPLWKYDKGFRADIGGIRSIAFSADGKHLACGGITEVTNAFAGIGHPLVVVFDTETGEKVQSCVASKKFRGKVTGVFVHPEGFVVGATSGHDGGHLLFWKLADPKEFFDFKMPDSARALDLHADKKRLVTAEPGGMARVWEMTEKSG